MSTYICDRAVRIDHVGTKNSDFLSLLCHNLLTININTTKSLPALKNLKRFLLQFTEMRYLHSEVKILAKI